MLQPSHICIHTYTYMLMARGVYVVRCPTLSNGLVVHKPTRPPREVECVGLREERGVGIERLVTVDYYCPAKSFNVLNPSMHADIPPHRSAQPRAVGS